MKKGLLHIYCGDGKGKSTAAVGLAVRAAGSGLRVLFCQCMKDGTSGEVSMLQKLGIPYCCCQEKFGFFWNMTEEQKEQAAHAYTHLFEDAARRAEEEGLDLLIVDEFMSAYNHGLIYQKTALEFLKNRPQSLEVVLTGRDPSPELLELADYVSEIRKVKHPYDRGISARKGIEL
ncbi:MAG: cob(I)yrinic acid a,c-diamide adenosyltransferase [Lachnospiraceae bacterium]|jgi:cob(I)alamin adenosyltransferase|nr:cob(I)yrinic acid a,c-diamide adenosyltransferase [Lachnospiraceae bacterium]MCI8994674.1 cob(I)yrinic acid a,c-diamide adenosyltransferase [Lachnospiraceae bacterium]MCI9134165.1 cob(I)yrinic acid a,c-diamide adenosyltransferase [Lachnospiraceae bacterium]